MPTPEDIEQQNQRLKDHRATLAHYLGQRARHGSAFEPPGVAAGIKEARESIAYCKAALRGWGVAVENHPDDNERLTGPGSKYLPSMLREPAADFVGRTGEIEQVTHAVLQASKHGAVAAITGVRGMGGVGKSELAYAVAQRLAPHFPDGQLLIELQGASSPIKVEQALQRLLISLGYQKKPQQFDLSTLQGLYRSALHGKRILILADDASDAQQVRPLLPPVGCALLITSRQRFTLPGMTTLDIRTLPPADAERLVLDICPRIGKHAAELARLCGYLPLALRVSASLLATNDDLALPAYLTRLADERTRLAQLRDPDSPDLDVEASLRLSYDALDTAAQQALSMMSAFPSNFSAQLVATMFPNEPEAILQRLRRRSLIDWDATTSLYSLHDLVRILTAQESNITNEQRALSLKKSNSYDLILRYQATFAQWTKARNISEQGRLKAESRGIIADLYQVLYFDLKDQVERWLKRRVEIKQDSSEIERDLVDVDVMAVFHAILPALPDLEINQQTNLDAELFALVENALSKQ